MLVVGRWTAKLGAALCFVAGISGCSSDDANKNSDTMPGASGTGASGGTGGKSSGGSAGVMVIDSGNGVSCSVHGACAVQGVIASCICDTGYHASGLACVADGGTVGLTSPSGHPRLLFNADNLQAARTWYATDPFTPRD